MPRKLKIVFMALACALLFTGCTLDKFEEKLQNWQSHSIAEVQEQWGAPTVVKKANDESSSVIYNLKEEHQMRLGQITEPQFESICNVVFEVDQQQRITAVSANGPACNSPRLVTPQAKSATRNTSASPLINVNPPATALSKPAGVPIMPASGIGSAEMESIKITAGAGSVQIELSAELQERLDREAGKRGLSRQQLLKVLLEQHLPQSPK